MPSPDALDAADRQFLKSRRNHDTERLAREFIIQDLRFQQANVATRRAALEAMGLSSKVWSAQSYDLLMTPEPMDPLTPDDVLLVPGLRLIDIKATRDAKVVDKRLNNFFFGTTEKQYALAGAAGDRFLFAFAVMHEANAYGRPFFVLLTLEEVMARTKTKRTQFQVNFRTDIVDDIPVERGPLPSPRFRRLT